MKSDIVDGSNYQQSGSNSQAEEVLGQDWKHAHYLHPPLPPDTHVFL